MPANIGTTVVNNSLYYRGIVWYRKHFSLPSAYAGRRITLYFEGAMTTAEVWINGTKLTTHYGGYMPFCYDMTQYCTFGGSDNVVALRLDNTKRSIRSDGGKNSPTNRFG
jgi:beta-galactosidase